jgi:pimeloyl-ACP methyl ester carboxylesterase
MVHRMAAGTIIAVAINLRGVVTVLLPGTGSDENYLHRVFAGPFEQEGAVVVAVPPRADDLIRGYRRALDEAALAGPIVVGGVSIGAVVAARWALDHPDQVVAVLAVLPPWSGPPGSAPAALSARHTAAQLRRDGLAATTAAMRASSPPWLADELTRSWSRQWPGLPNAMDEAAAYPGPSAADLSRLNAPMGVVAASDDLIHPMEVASEWVSSAPRAALCRVTLEQFGPDPAVLGAAGVAALKAVD